MKFSIALLLCISALSQGTLALAQPISERVQNGRRVCTYEGSPGPHSGDQASRTTYVEPTQNCPGAMPPRPGLGSPPGTAQLYASETENGRRLCTYVQGPEQWTRSLDIGRVCPMAAGMLPAESDERPSGQTRRRPIPTPSE